MSTVYLFPGQGSQYPGMAKDLYEHSKAVRELFKTAGNVFKKSMEDLLFEGSEDDLKSTDNTQVALTLANISAATVLREHGVLPSVLLGFSLGEYAALHEAGVLDTETVFRIVAIRGEVMEKGAREADRPGGRSAMTAVLGLPFEEAQTVIESLAADDVYIANHSSPTQIVLAGTAEGLDRAEDALSEAGAMRVVRLKVSGPFHSPLLMNARKEFEERIAGLPFSDPKIPVISNVTALPLEDGNDARKRLGEQIVSMVRWVESQGYLINNGIITGSDEDMVLEAGPGRVLAGLWKSFYKGVRVQQSGTLKDIVENLR